MDVNILDMEFFFLGSRIDQAVIDICQADWEELKTNLKITKKMIEIPSS